MRKILFAVALACFGLSASAQVRETSELTKLQTAHDVSGWEAVGRLNIGWGGMCTGALITPRVVLTAAHCAFDKTKGDVIDAGDIVFHAGFRNGRATASRRVSRVIVHPSYVFSGVVGDANVANDLALFELDSEIALSNINPFRTASRPRKGQQVDVVSYAHNRADSPSLEEACNVLARQRQGLVLSCNVDFGSSGAPIFADFDGGPRIVSVVSAMAEVRGRKVALGTNLEKPLGDLLRLLNSSTGTVAPAPEVSIIKPNATRRLSQGDGAKFLRP